MTDNGILSNSATVHYCPVLIRLCSYCNYQTQEKYRIWFRCSLWFCIPFFFIL